jgi:hypothetical protein
MNPKSALVPSRRPDYSADFDAIEVYNGLDVAARRGVGQVLADFRRLLAQGHRYSATGNSDSHKLFFIDPGLPRNLIRYRTAASDSDDLKAPIDDILKAIRAGRILVTSGPIIDADVGGAGPGETGRSQGGVVDLHVRIRAAPWIDVRRVSVLLGDGEKPVAERTLAASKDAVRFEESFRLAAKGPTFVVVVAEGDTELPNVHAANSRPFAFTNPIWIAP